MAKVERRFHLCLWFSTYTVSFTDDVLTGFYGLALCNSYTCFATKILHGGPQTLGFLMAAAALGALIASIYLSSRNSVVGLENIIAISPTILGIGFIIFPSPIFFGFRCCLW
jgi:hypothetical protein